MKWPDDGTKEGRWPGEITNFEAKEEIAREMAGRLRDGDVVTSVGGQELNDPTQAIALLNSLRNASSLNITVMRNGRPVDLSYQIQ